MRAGLYRRDDEGALHLVSQHDVIEDPLPNGTVRHSFLSPPVERQAGDLLLFLNEGPDGHHFLTPFPWPGPAGPVAPSLLPGFAPNGRLI